MLKFIVIFFFVLPTIVFAQSEDGNLYGKVFIDSEIAPGAVVILEQINQSVLVNERGEYQFNSIPNGVYQIRVTSYNIQPYSEEVVIDKERNVLDFYLYSTEQVLDEVLIEKDLEQKAIENSALQVKTIKVDDIATKVKDFNQVVDQLSGVRVRTSGSLGDKADISLNGLNGTAIRTYIDGLPLEFVYPSMSLGNVPLSNIERVNVYKGVVPLNVGSDALGGAINLVTKINRENELKADYGYGSFNTHLASLSGNKVLKNNLIVNGVANYNYSDNNYTMRDIEIIGAPNENRYQDVERFHDAYSLLFLQGAASLVDKSWADEISITANYSNYEKEIQNGNQITRVAYGEALYDGSVFSSNLNFKKNINQKLDLHTKFLYSLSETNYLDTSSTRYNWKGEAVRFNQRGGEYGGSKSDATRDDAGFINRTNLVYYATPNDELTFSNLFARNLANGRDKLIEDPNDDPLQFDQILIKNIAGLMYQRYLFNDALTLSATGKYYSFNVQGNDDALSGKFVPIEKSGNDFGYSGSFKYDINEDFRLKGSYERAYRIPLAYQYFGNGQLILANANLETESSNNANFGVSYNREFNQFGLETSLNGFLRQQKDIIYLAGSEVQKFINAEEVDSEGIEFDLRLQLPKNFILSGNLTKLTKEYTAVNNKTSEFLIGTPFPNTPNFFYNINIEYKPNYSETWQNRIGAYVFYKYVDEFNFLNTSGIRNDDNYIPVQNRLDAGASYYINNQFKVSANVNNVLNEDLYDNYKINRPLINYNIRFNYKLNNNDY